MAKEIITKESKETKEYGKFQWFFMIIVIPFIFAVILTTVVLSFMGINILEQSKQIIGKVPIVSTYVVNDGDELKEEVDVTELQATITSQQKELQLLQGKSLESEEEIESLQRENSSLTDELKQLKDQQSEWEIAKEAERAEIIKTYESMSSKNAAAIIGQLETDEALRHISELKAETKAAILAKMEPEKAAKIMTALFTN